MKTLVAALVGMGLAAVGWAAEEAATNAAPPKAEAEKAAAKFVVILPEQLDGVWYWTYFTTEQQHIVQSAVEKALVDAGLDVVDLGALKLGGGDSLQGLLNPATAAGKAKEAGAAYVIVGSATAVPAGSSTAYGVPVARATASLTAKIVRAGDGKILAVKEAEANEGGQAMRGAGQAALKKAGRDLASALAEAAKKIAAEGT